MIEVNNLTKTFRTVKAVDNATFTVQPGKVTGFLGPNGAGKSTTMRMILGLEIPDSGSATINGVPYTKIPNPLTVVGAVLEAKSLHPSRSITQHLRWLAASNDIDPSRIEETLAFVGLASASKRKGKELSLGMAQRLGIAAALLGNPEVLILDEPINGLDPEGILWIRKLLRALADEGKTVFVSSHIMSEVAQVADQVVVINRGRILADTPVREFVASHGGDSIFVRTPDPDRLRNVVKEAGGSYHSREENTLIIANLTMEQVGELAARESIVLWELRAENTGLEQAFMSLTAGEAR
jgi:ABC-2 type transport system ATP-binding protein